MLQTGFIRVPFYSVANVNRYFRTALSSFWSRELDHTKIMTKFKKALNLLG